MSDYLTFAKAKHPTVQRLLDNMFKVQRTLTECLACPKRYVAPFTYPEAFWNLSMDKVDKLLSIPTDADVSIRPGITQLSGTVYVKYPNSGKEDLFEIGFNKVSMMPFSVVTSTTAECRRFIHEYNRIAPSKLSDHLTVVAESVIDTTFHAIETNQTLMSEDYDRIIHNHVDDPKFRVDFGCVGLLNTPMIRITQRIIDGASLIFRIDTVDDVIVSGIQTDYHDSCQSSGFYGELLLASMYPTKLIVFTNSNYDETNSQ